MRHTLWSLALIAPLALGACKKKSEPEPMAEPAPVEEVEKAPMAPLAWTWGPAMFTGSRAADSTGTLAVPVKVKNQTEDGLILKVLSVGIVGADGGKPTCMAKEQLGQKASGGFEIETTLSMDCAYTALPDSGPLMGKVTAIYTLGGEDKTDTVETKIPFKR